MMHRWTFRQKVTGGSLVTVGLAVLTATLAVYAIHTAVASKDRVLAVNAQNMIDAARLVGAVDRQSAGFRGYLAWPEDRFLQERSIALQEFSATLQTLRRRAYSTEEKELLRRVEATHEALVSLQQEAIQQRVSKAGLESVVRLMKERDLPVRDELARNANAFAALEQHLLEAAGADATSRASLASSFLIAMAIAAIVFALGTALLLGRTLSRQIGSVVQHVQSSSAELQTCANQQVSGARETATAMSEVTTTMSELVASSRQIAESAQQVAQIAEKTAAAAQEGDQTLSQTQQSIHGIRGQVELIVNHMLDLGKKSQQIGGILDIIDELAEQTNILSINAMIEAAGAGEQGKRFAVVGDEIRKLADRVSQSGKEIRTLVEEVRAAVHTTVLATEGGSKAVDSGLRQFGEVTRAFTQIASLVNTTTQASREIKLSTKQQISAVEQVNAGITGAAQAARQTESGSSQTLQTASQLASLSRNLSQIIEAPAHV